MSECVDDHTCVNHVFRIYINTHDEKPLVADGKPSEIISIFKKIRPFEKIPKNGYNIGAPMFFTPNFQNNTKYS